LQPTVLLVGMGITAASALESLGAVARLVGVVRPAAADDAVAKRAQTLSIPVFADASSAGLRAAVEQLSPDCVVVSSYDRILKPELLRLSRFVNVHYSPLPRYRGRANVNWAIINDEPVTAITIHVIAPGLDAGNILFQELMPLGPRDTIGEVYRRLNELQQRHLGPTVLRYLQGFGGHPQQESAASYGCTRLAHDGLIDWSAATRRIDCLIRALDEPFPGAFTYLQDKRLIVWRAAPLEPAPLYSGRIPGRVVGIYPAQGAVDVLTGDGVLRLFEVQLESAARVQASMIIRSVRTSLGLSIPELLDQIRTLQQRLDALGS